MEHTKCRVRSKNSMAFPITLSSVDISSLRGGRVDGMLLPVAVMELAVSLPFSC